MSIEIRAVDEADLPRVLPLISGYQEFYEVEGISEERNRAFFSRFLPGSDEGWLIGAFRGGEPVGFTCVYRHKSSLSASDVALMYDLYVDPDARGEGLGRSLIEAAAELGRRSGATSLSWSTAPDNQRAQRLYDSTGADKSTWIEYELKLG